MKVVLQSSCCVVLTYYMPHKHGTMQYLLPTWVFAFAWSVC
jgi:hypothetical protein